jgi:SAM-dependent methyltransferase
METITCQGCGAKAPPVILDLGELPLVNDFATPGSGRGTERYPAQWLHCPVCNLVQLGHAVERTLVFPPDYPYASGDTRIKRDNFEDLCRECLDLVNPAPSDLILDVGSNDGSLLKPFHAKGHRVLGVEPTDIAERALAEGIPTLKAFFDAAVASRLKTQQGPAKVICATNILAHVDNIGEILDATVDLLAEDGVLICEVQYLFGVLDSLSVDSIYHEHLRYYGLDSLRRHLHRHGLEVFQARHLKTHSGSIRVHAARPGRYPVGKSVDEILDQEKQRGPLLGQLTAFAGRAHQARESLRAIFRDTVAGKRVFGIGAAPRSAALLNYVQLDEKDIACVLEVPGSPKIGKLVPGTAISVVDESLLFQEQPDFAILLSWHIADMLVPKIRDKGYGGKFIIPLPEPRVL